MDQQAAVESVFTPGRAPGVTYNPRSSEDLEGNISRFLINRGAALTVSGPTKSGKTVVVERLLPRHAALWINGGDLDQLNDLWDQVIEFLSLSDQVQTRQSTGEGASVAASLSLGVPGVGKMSANLGGKSQTTTEVTTTATRPASAVARDALREWQVPIVIDDFHYVRTDLKVPLARAVKGLIEYSPVVLIAVPQDAFRAVRDETDLLGRVWQLQIKPWTTDELIYIAQAGFDALNIGDENDAVARELAENSLGAPFLMQQLCLDYCLDEGVIQRKPIRVQVAPPPDLAAFYGRVAARYVPGVFDALRMGPRTKGQPRLARRLKTGQVTDIYGAVLYGISKIGPVRQISTQQLTRTIGEHFVDAPTTQNVASALGHMRTIADSQRGSSDTALDYKDDTLYISDPFLSFYLRFGAWELPGPPVGGI